MLMLYANTKTRNSKALLKEKWSKSIYYKQFHNDVQIY